MTERVAFLMKDLGLFAVSVYLLKQDVIRVTLSAKQGGVVLGNVLQEAV